MRIGKFDMDIDGYICTFFFCLRHPSQARPFGTPGIVGSDAERRVDLKGDLDRGLSSFSIVNIARHTLLKAKYAVPRKVR